MEEHTNLAARLSDASRDCWAPYIFIWQENVLGNDPILHDDCMRLPPNELWDDDCFGTQEDLLKKYPRHVIRDPDSGNLMFSMSVDPEGYKVWHEIFYPNYPTDLGPAFKDIEAAPQRYVSLFKDVLECQDVRAVFALWDLTQWLKADSDYMAETPCKNAWDKIEGLSRQKLHAMIAPQTSADLDLLLADYSGVSQKLRSPFDALTDNDWTHLWSVEPYPKDAHAVDAGLVDRAEKFAWICQMKAIAEKVEALASPVRGLMHGGVRTPDTPGVK